MNIPWLKMKSEDLDVYIKIEDYKASSNLGDNWVVVSLRINGLGLQINNRDDDLAIVHYEWIPDTPVNPDY